MCMTYGPTDMRYSNKQNWTLKNQSETQLGIALSLSVINLRINGIIRRITKACAPDKTRCVKHSIWKFQVTDHVTVLLKWTLRILIGPIIFDSSLALIELLYVRYF